ncbi:MAG: hypothetical protein E7040_01340 [Lentisphaerae bacterium]|nr:hypothetical protein [Lentisphaerota bacterium]
MKDVFISLAIVLGKRDSLTMVESYAGFLKENYSDYEILLLATEDIPNISELLRYVDKIRFLQISNTSDYEILCAAALENAIGDITIIGRLENLTKDIIEQGVSTCFEGSDIVIGCTDISCPAWYRFGSRIFRTAVSRVINYNIPINDSGLRIVSRRAANTIISKNRFHRNLFLQMNHCGYTVKTLEYRCDKRLKKPHSLAKIYNHAVSILILNSTKPLRFMNVLGLFSSFISFLFALYSVVVHLFKRNVVEGWTTQILFTSIQFFFLFLILAFLGEYILRLLSNQNNTSSYNVVLEKHSSVMLDLSRLNVISESTASEVNLTQTGRDR